MKAIQVVAPQKVEFVDMEEPQLADYPKGSMKVRVEYACLCGSDVPLLAYGTERLAKVCARPWDLDGVLAPGGKDPFPFPAGQSIHECVGSVVETTSSRFQVGDFVLAQPKAKGGFCEFFCTDEDQAIHIPREGVPKEQILMTQPLGTVIWMARKLENIVGKHTAIVGMGPMGLMIAHVLANLGARSVIALDKLDYRLEAAKKMRATHTVNVDKENAIEALLKITDGMLADLVVEAVGHQQESINETLEYVRREGSVIIFGAPDEITYNDFAMQVFFEKNIRLVSSVLPDVQADFSLARDLIAQGRVNVEPIITHILPFQEAQKAIDLFVERKDGAIKVVIDYTALE